MQKKWSAPFKSFLASLVLSKIHLRLLNQSEKYELVGFYDPFKENAEKVAAEFGYKPFDSISELIQAVDVVDIVTPTLSHYECAVEAIKAGKHIFLEKPISKSKGYPKCPICQKATYI